MLDKVYYKSECEVILYYTHRSPVTLYHSDGRIIELLDEFLAPIGSNCVSLSSYRVMIEESLEDTLVINLDDVA